MKRGATLFLQAVVVLVGLGTLAVMLWEPHVEGRNAHASVFEIYFKDPFLAYVYAASSAFFVALYQAFKLLGYLRREQAFSTETVRASRTIKYCALALVGFVAIGLVIILIVGDREDRPAGVFMSVLASFVAVVMASAATVFERIFQNAVDLKSENDLTV